MKKNFFAFKRLFINTSKEKIEEDNEIFEEFTENYNQLVADFKASLAH